MVSFPYRLQPLLEQKEERKRECERRAQIARALLIAAEEQLAVLRGQQSAIERKKAGARAAIFEQERSGEDVGYLVQDVQLFHRRLEIQKDAVQRQRIEIEERNDAAKAASTELAAATHELEVLHKHKSKSERRFLAEVERKETLEQDEIASTMHEARRRR